MFGVTPYGDMFHAVKTADIYGLHKYSIGDGKWASPTRNVVIADVDNYTIVQIN